MARQSPFIKTISSIPFLLFLFWQVKPVDEDSLKAWQTLLKKYPPPKDAKELVFVDSIPKDSDQEESFFWGAKTIAADENDNIYVADSKAHQILKFDRVGKFIKRFGRQGRAPGEIENIWKIVFYQGTLIANDVGNMRFQYYDREGNFIKGFKVFKTYLDFDVDSEGLIYAVPIRSTKSERLVEVIDSEGKLIHELGNPLDFQRDWQQLNHAIISLDEEDNILLAFVHFPIVRKYDRQGRLIYERKYPIGFQKKQMEMNYQFEKISRNSRALVGYIVMNDAIKAAKGVWIMNSYPRLEIKKFDYEGNLQDIFWKNRTQDYHASAFLLKIGDKSGEFFVLQTSPENKIEKYKFNH